MSHLYSIDINKIIVDDYIELNKFTPLNYDIIQMIYRYLFTKYPNDQMQFLHNIFILNKVCCVKHLFIILSNSFIQENELKIIKLVENNLEMFKRLIKDIKYPDVYSRNYDYEKLNVIIIYYLCKRFNIPFPSEQIKYKYKIDYISDFLANEMRYDSHYFQLIDKYCLKKNIYLTLCNLAERNLLSDRLVHDLFDYYGYYTKSDIKKAIALLIAKYGYGKINIQVSINCIFLRDYIKVFIDKISEDEIINILKFNVIMDLRDDNVLRRILIVILNNPRECKSFGNHLFKQIYRASPQIVYDYVKTVNSEKFTLFIDQKIKNIR